MYTENTEISLKHLFTSEKVYAQVRRQLLSSQSTLGNKVSLEDILHSSVKLIEYTFGEKDTFECRYILNVPGKSPIEVNAIVHTSPHEAQVVEVRTGISRRKFGQAFLLGALSLTTRGMLEGTTKAHLKENILHEEEEEEEEEKEQHETFYHEIFIGEKSILLDFEQLKPSFPEFVSMMNAYPYWRELIGDRADFERLYIRFVDWLKLSVASLNDLADLQIIKYPENNLETEFAPWYIYLSAISIALESQKISQDNIPTYSHTHLSPEHAALGALLAGTVNNFRSFDFNQITKEYLEKDITIERHLRTPWIVPDSSPLTNQVHHMATDFQHSSEVPDYWYWFDAISKNPAPLESLEAFKTEVYDPSLKFSLERNGLDFDFVWKKILEFILYLVEYPAPTNLEDLKQNKELFSLKVILIGNLLPDSGLPTLKETIDTLKILFYALCTHGSVNFSKTVERGDIGEPPARPEEIEDPSIPNLLELLRDPHIPKEEFFQIFVSKLQTIFFGVTNDINGRLDNFTDVEIKEAFTPLAPYGFGELEKIDIIDQGGGFSHKGANSVICDENQQNCRPNVTLYNQISLGASAEIIPTASHEALHRILDHWALHRPAISGMIDTNSAAALGLAKLKIAKLLIREAAFQSTSEEKAYLLGLDSSKLTEYLTVIGAYDKSNPSDIKLSYNEDTNPREFQDQVNGLLGQLFHLFLGPNQDQFLITLKKLDGIITKESTNFIGDQHPRLLELHAQNSEAQVYLKQRDLFHQSIRIVYMLSLAACRGELASPRDGINITELLTEKKLMFSDLRRISDYFNLVTPGRADAPFAGGRDGTLMCALRFSLLSTVEQGTYHNIVSNKNYYLAQFGFILGHECMTLGDMSETDRERYLLRVVRDMGFPLKEAAAKILSTLDIIENYLYSKVGTYTGAVSEGTGPNNLYPHAYEVLTGWGLSESSDDTPVAIEEYILRIHTNFTRIRNSFDLLNLE